MKLDRLLKSTALSAVVATLAFVGSAAAQEARRAVRELGAVAVIGNPNPINGRHIHDPEFEILWDTVEELGVEPTQRLGKFIPDLFVTVAVQEIRGNKVYVIGQVNRPGRYPVDGKRTVLEVLALAGGVAPDGGDMVTLLRKRDGKPVREQIDIVDMARKGDMQRDLDLLAGDVL